MTDDDIPIFDAHTDIPSSLLQVYGVREASATADRTVLEDEFLPEMRANNIMARIAAIYIDDEHIPEAALHRGLAELQHVRNEIRRIEDIEIATTADDIRQNAAADTMSFVFGMEGVEPLHRDITMLDTFYDLGVRVVGLTHARRNFAAHGPSIFDSDADVNHGGLSAYGHDIVTRLNQKDMLIDTAHINQTAFWDIIDVTDAPIINSHSNARALYDHPRNLTDDQLQAVADTGGVVSLNALPPTYAADTPTIDDLLRHLDYVIEAIGIEHVGVGFDYWAYLLSDDDDVDASMSGLQGLNDDSEVDNLPTALRNHGFDEEDVRRILWENNLRVLDDVLS